MGISLQQYDILRKNVNENMVKGKVKKDKAKKELKKACQDYAYKFLSATTNLINIKPLSVNDAWMGRRFKTDKYKLFEKELLSKLKPLELPEKPYSINYVFGFSNAASDIDNPVKQTTDVLCKKYGFNDRDIWELNVRKVLTEKGKEFISFEIKSL